MIFQKDILLVPFPFSDQSGRKVRPVVVVSNNNFNKTAEDIIVIGMTSNMSKDKYTVGISSINLEDGQIDLCCIKVENILKLDKSLVIKKIGKIKDNILNEIIIIINHILKEQNQ